MTMFRAIIVKSCASATVLRSLHELVHFSFVTVADQLSDNTVRESNHFKTELNFVPLPDVF